MSDLITRDLDGVTIKAPSLAGHSARVVVVSNERLTALARQRYYTSDIDGSYLLTRALVEAGLLDADGHGHLAPTRLLDRLCAEIDDVRVLKAG